MIVQNKLALFTLLSNLRILQLLVYNAVEARESFRLITPQISKCSTYDKVAKTYLKWWFVQNYHMHASRVPECEIRQGLNRT